MSVSINGFVIDAFISVAPSRQATVTKHPVDEGAEVNDHIILAPEVVTIEGVVTDTPLAAVTRDSATKPSSDAYAFLTKLQSEKTLVEIISNVYPPFSGMAMTSLSAPKTSKTGDSLRFNATFQHINIVSVASEQKQTLVALPRERKKVRKGSKPAEKKDLSEVKQPTGVDESWLRSGGKKISEALF